MMTNRPVSAAGCGSVCVTLVAVFRQTAAADEELSMFATLAMMSLNIEREFLRTGC